mmetsp:Transcript_35237/g.42049  ORF Transcript_35237/g.42049 Transcript_35237/m.42049 type:complete len:321 (-) Transcript_35237:144-1106(-)
MIYSPLVGRNYCSGLFAKLCFERRILFFGKIRFDSGNIQCWSTLRKLRKVRCDIFLKILSILLLTCKLILIRIYRSRNTFRIHLRILQCILMKIRHIAIGIGSTIIHRGVFPYHSIMDQITNIRLHTRKFFRNNRTRLLNHRLQRIKQFSIPRVIPRQHSHHSMPIRRGKLRSRHSMWFTRGIHQNSSLFTLLRNVTKGGGTLRGRVEEDEVFEGDAEFFDFGGEFPVASVYYVSGGSYDGGVFEGYFWGVGCEVDCVCGGDGFSSVGHWVFFGSVGHSPIFRWFDRVQSVPFWNWFIKCSTITRHCRHCLPPYCSVISP